MNESLKKIFLPFSTEEYKFLDNKWWHRLMKVLFAVWIIFWLYLLRTNISYMDLCIKWDSQNFGYSYIGALRECINWDTNWEYFSIYNILLPLVITIFSYYILQIIYFKIVIYIIYGNKRK